MTKIGKVDFFLCMLEHCRWYRSKALVKLSPLQSSLGKSTVWIKSYERSKFRARGPSRGLAGLQRRKFSKFGDQLRSAPKSLWILFEAGQTRLGHSRGEWRKKIFDKKNFSKCPGPTEAKIFQVWRPTPIGPKIAVDTIWGRANTIKT